MGRFICCATARATPPLAVLSSLVKTTPLSFATSEKTCAWRRPFWPRVASKTRRDSTLALGTFLSIMRRIFDNSSIKFFLFCKRPAVSTKSNSALRDWAAMMLSKTTAAGSVFFPGLAITGVPLRSPQILTCSTAAARKVSAAAIRQL